MSKTERASLPPRVSLLEIWKVDADRTYKVQLLKPRKSDEYIAIRTISGCGMIELSDSTKYKLSCDTLFIIARRQIIKYYCIEDKWRFNWFNFCHCEMITRIYGIVYKIPVKADEKITMDHCFTYLKCNTNTMSVTASTLFALLLLKWNEYIGIAGNNTDNNHSDQVFKILVTGIIYDMKKNYSIKSLADSLNMCERNFRQKFIKSIGIPPKRYIETQRLDSAAELLISTSLLVKEISKMAGYEDEHYFSRIFKKNYGITPKKYRINSAIE